MYQTFLIQCTTTISYNILKKSHIKKKIKTFYFFSFISCAIYFSIANSVFDSSSIMIGVAAFKVLKKPVLISLPTRDIADFACLLYVVDDLDVCSICLTQYNLTSQQYYFTVT